MCNCIFDGLYTKGFTVNMFLCAVNCFFIIIFCVSSQQRDLSLFLYNRKVLTYRPCDDQLPTSPSTPTDLWRRHHRNCDTTETAKLWALIPWSRTHNSQPTHYSLTFAVPLNTSFLCKHSILIFSCAKRNTLMCTWELCQLRKHSLVQLMFKASLFFFQRWLLQVCYSHFTTQSQYTVTPKCLFVVACVVSWTAWPWI